MRRGQVHCSGGRWENGPGGVLQQQSLIAFDHHDGVLVEFPAESEEGGIQIQGVATDNVKQAAVACTHPFHQPFRGSLFAFSVPDQLGVQRDGQFVTNQMAGDDPVVVLGDLSILQLDRTCLAFRATPFSAGEEFMSIESGKVPAGGAGQGLVAFQEVGDGSQPVAEGITGQSGVHASHGVHAGHPPADESPEA